ncbi:MAG: phosphatidylserine decarboxylase family protein [Bacteroidales bacterium]
MKKYYIHKEGRNSIVWMGVLLILMSLLVLFFYDNLYIRWGIPAFCFVLWLAIIAFFRMPRREYPVPTEKSILSPADGVVVDIDEVYETEYFKDNRIKISVFMSPANIHVNRYPVDGLIVYCLYHPGKYLVAWHPKSSSLNERNTVVVKTKDGKEVLVRQIAGAVARRIVSYAKKEDKVIHGQELGFIKFGSRVDLFLPLDVDIKVELEEKVRGGISVLAEL